MNLKSILIIEIEKNDHKFQFSMPAGVSYGEAYDAAFKVLHQVLEMAKNVADQASPELLKQKDENHGG